MLAYYLDKSFQFAMLEVGSLGERDYKHLLATRFRLSFQICVTNTVLKESHLLLFLS